MLNRHAFFMLLTLTIMAFSAEARASCAASQGCVCTFSSNLSATFTGTVVEGHGHPGEDTSSLKIRIDELSAVDTSSKLEVGSVADAEVITVDVEVETGDRVLGYSQLTCADSTSGCDTKPLDRELISVRALLDSAGFVPCGPALRFSSADAREFLLDPDCEEELSKRLGTEGDVPACHDLGGCLCSAPGARSTSGLPAALGLLAIVGAWGLRRSRR